MAIGDDALADGMLLVPGTTPAKDIDTEINRTRDYIVQRIVAKLGALWPLPINKGGTGKATAPDALAALGAWQNFGAVSPGSAPKLGLGGTGRLVYEIPGYASATVLANLSDIPTGSSAYDGYLNPAIYSRSLTGWRSLAIQADGTIGQTSSARRFKENVTALDITDAQLARLELVEFDWKADGSHDVGLIADDVAEVLPWAVFHDENGLVLGIHYERLALALLPALQRVTHDMELIAQRLAALEEK